MDSGNFSTLQIFYISTKYDYKPLNAFLGFILSCLEFYNYKSSEVINAILEENLPPHLAEIPRDKIIIPPEPEPEKPVLAYKGKKPDYDDALKLLNDKSDIKQLKTYVLEGM